MLGQKRGFMEDEEGSEPTQKRVKMRDLDSVLRSEGQAGLGVSKPKDFNPASVTLDLNASVDATSYLLDTNSQLSRDKTSNLPISGNEKVMHKDSHANSRGFDLDLNAEDVSSSINRDPFFPYKNYEYLKSRDQSECGSSIGPVEEKDSMRVWKEMKQNGYLSSVHRPATAQMPKPRGRKSKNDIMKKKMEFAKKEHVDRFAKVAAPSGLLNGLNPGIINHVRNSKQVHSIIEALVRSAKKENRRAGSETSNHMKAGTKEVSEGKGPESLNFPGVHAIRSSHEDILSGSKEMMGFPSLSKSISFRSALTGGEGESYTLEGGPTHYEQANEEDGLSLKLSSSANTSENTSHLSNEESANLSTVTSLSVKAANVASQWLELLNQDIKGRLAALRRSKKRIRSVISTELPFLWSREFSSNQENDSQMTTAPATSGPGRATADAHFARWSNLFGQMDKALAEEESLLENWLNQVKDMQLHCDKGLYKHQVSELTGPMGSVNRLGEADHLERNLAVRAAAASIYSTCDFLSSKNLPCF